MTHEERVTCIELCTRKLREVSALFEMGTAVSVLQSIQVAKEPAGLVDKCNSHLSECPEKGKTFWAVRRGIRCPCATDKLEELINLSSQVFSKMYEPLVLLRFLGSEEPLPRTHPVGAVLRLHRNGYPLRA